MHPDLYAVVYRQHEAEIVAAAERRRQVAERSDEPTRARRGFPRRVSVGRAVGDRP